MATRKASRDETKKKLIRAVIEVLHEHGRGALTTGRVAAAAGVAQPTFYVHFSDMEDALTQAADRVSERLLQNLRDHRADLRVGGPDELLDSTFRGSLDALLREPPMIDLFLRHRRDVDSPFGRRFRKLYDRACVDLGRDIARLGFGPPVVAHPEIHAELIVGMTLTMTEAILDGRVTDRDAAVEALAHFSRASMARALELAGGSGSND